MNFCGVYTRCMSPFKVSNLEIQPKIGQLSKTYLKSYIKICSKKRLCFRNLKGNMDLGSSRLYRFMRSLVSLKMEIEWDSLRRCRQSLTYSRRLEKFVRCLQTLYNLNITCFVQLTTWSTIFQATSLRTSRQPREPNLF